MWELKGGKDSIEAWPAHTPIHNERPLGAEVVDQDRIIHHHSQRQHVLRAGFLVGVGVRES